MNDSSWQEGDYYGTGLYPTMGMAIASLTATSSYNASAYWYERSLLEFDPESSPYDNVFNVFDMEKELLERAIARSEVGIDANCYLY